VYEVGKSKEEVPLSKAFDDLLGLVAERNSDFYECNDGKLEKVQPEQIAGRVDREPVAVVVAFRSLLAHRLEVRRGRPQRCEPERRGGLEARQDRADPYR
jgi:hypothetical protein